MKIRDENAWRTGLRNLCIISEHDNHDYSFAVALSQSHNRDFAFFVFERTKHQPRRNLHSYLVLQRLCNEAALSPGMMHFGTRSWSKMVVSWRYANLSTELSRKFCVATA